MGSYTLTGYIVFILNILSVKVQGEVRLQGGSNIFEGIVEVYDSDSNNWVGVCLDDFDLIDAEVVCQQIFQQSAISVVDGSQFGHVTSGDQLSGVACTEADTTIQNCQNSGYTNVCTTSAGVICKLYGYYGCYTNAVVTALQGAFYTGRADLTIQDCIERCRNAGYTFSGTMNGQQCSCGNTIEKSPGDDSIVAESFCNVPCSGDSSEICGGDGYTSIYISSIGQQGGTYTSTDGYIYSPNFPGAYMGESVSWTVTFENPTFTTVTIKMFDVSANDQLVLTSTGGSIETHLGSSAISLPYVWETGLTSSFQIQLMSSTTESNNGLVITYKAITGTCGGSFSGTSGYIASPEFPNDAPPSSSCTYTITAPDNYIIELDLQQRLLPSGSFLNSVDNGAIDPISSLGIYGPSTGNVLMVSFMSGTTSSPSTFVIKYTASQRPCDALPTISSGTLDPGVTGTVYPPLTVSFTCDQGYSSPDNSITCMNDGTWTSAECTAISTARATTTRAAMTTRTVTTEAVTTKAVTTKAATTMADTTQPGQTPATATASEAPTTSTSAPMTTDSTTATSNQPTQAVVVSTMLTTQTPQISDAPVTEQATSDLCRVSMDPIMESLDMREPENMLALNVGNPLDCDGYVTGIEIFSSDTSTVTISVLRFLETDMYQLIGRFDVVGQTSMVVNHTLDQDDWIKFESGDMIGTSSESSSPLSFSNDQADSVDYMIWDLSVDAEFHTSDVGDVISLTNTNNRPTRTYSWAVFVKESSDIECANRNIPNAKITDSATDNSIIVQCHDGYLPETAKTLKCLADGTFESFTCTEKDRKTFVITIAVVCVGIIGILMITVIVMMVCVEEEEPIKQKPKLRSTFASTGSGRSDNSQRFLIIEDDGGRDLGVSNPIPVVAEPPSHLADHQYPPVDYPLDDERAAIQAIDEAVLGFEVDSLSFESGAIDTRSGGDSTRHHVTFSDRR